MRSVLRLAAVIYLLTVPAGAYVYFMEPGSEYTSKSGAAIVAALTILGIVLCAIPEKRHPENTGRTNE